MDFLTNLLENSTMPWLSALVLGLMTAISPCPLATNITAVGFISKDIENRNRVFVNGLLYTLGRAISYTAIALIIYFGADQFKFSGFFQLYGEKIIRPLLFIIGLFMLDVIKIKFPGMSGLTSKMEAKTKWGFFDAILLGMIFALAFCPYSGVLYFGMLVPMTVASASGLYLPILLLKHQLRDQEISQPYCSGDIRLQCVNPEIKDFHRYYDHYPMISIVLFVIAIFMVTVIVPISVFYHFRACHFHYNLG